MRFILSILLALPLLAQGQLCSEPSPVSYAGFGAQQTQADFFPGADYLDGLNNSSYWSLGSGISDNNLCIKENSDITTFLGVKLRNTTAPNDNTASAGNVYFVEPGYSPASQNGPTGSGPEATWNILMYAGIDGGAFDSVQVVLHIDFDPCYGYTEEDMYSIDIGSAFEANPFTQASDFSSFGINTNLGSTEIANLNPAGTGFDATIEGYYTFAIEVLNNCGTRRMWNEITVYVQSETTAEGDAVADANGNGVYDDNEVDGCQLSAACNYDCNATTNSGCEYTSCSGCTVSDACNYNSEATIPDSESCQYPLDIYGVSYVDCDGNCTTDSDSDGVCDEAEVVGCQDETACNFNANATDAGSCEFATTYYDCNDVCLNDADADGVCDELEVNGCTAGSACNYDEDATEDDGSCDYATCAGCTVVSACNYDAGKSISDLASCVYATGCDSCSGETDGTGTVVDGDSDNDGVCNDEEIDGCTDATACNYDSNATDDDGSCSILDALGVCGGSCSTDADGDGICDDVDNCTNTSACNYNASANEACDLSSCAGCTVTSACNYDSGATISSPTCVYADTGNCESCSGEQDGSGTIVDGDSDNDGVCDADEVPGCTSTSACNYSSAATDDDGSCASLDALGVCGGSCSTDADNDGICDDVDNCTNTSACNYNDSANEACESTSCAGCTVDSACNYDSSATISLDVCTYATGCDTCSGAQDGSGTIVDGDTDNDGVCNANEVQGCTDNTQCNFNPLATDDDGTCLAVIQGCTIESDCNYNPAACTHVHSMCSPASGGSTACSGGNVGGNPPPVGMLSTCENEFACNYQEEGTCEFTSCVGCMNTAGCDYDVNNLYPALCDYSCYGCTNASADNYDSEDPATIDDGSCIISGCTTIGACNYDAAANNDDGSCEVTSCVGCGTPSACNYDSSVTLNEPISCVYATGCDSCSGETDGTGSVVDGDSDDDGVCNADEIGGCTIASACNYNSSATDNDGSCLSLDACGVCGGTGVDSDGDGVCDANEVLGCTLSAACNYSEAATENDGTCDFISCVGCMDESACNFDPSATLNQLLDCTYAETGYDCSGTCNNDSDTDGICDEFEVPGCTDSSACNYSASATDNDGSCTYPSEDYLDCDGNCTTDEDEDGVCDELEVFGCDIASACNYSAEATENDGTCEFSSCAGCTIPTACNYDETATLSNNVTCTYIPEGWDDCDQTICTDSDNDGICDFDEPAGCVGEFNEPHLSLSGVVETAVAVGDWSSTDFAGASSDDTGVQSTTFVDYIGRLADGRYSVTRVYTVTDVCANTSQAGQLLIADETHPSGCTNANATSYEPDAINDDGSCDYSPACLGDLNLDNIVGTSDLLILLSSFGLPCAE